jgi:protein-disulfide isomerase
MNMENNMDEEKMTVVEESPKAKRDRFLPITILVAAVLIAGAVVFSSLYHSGGAGADATNPLAAQPPAAPSVNTAAIMKLGANDAVLGNDNAPVTLIEYGDYQCPYCGQFFAQTEPSIISAYVNTGKVRMVFRNFAFLGAESTAAAEAADCAQDQGKLWQYHDALYAAKVGDAEKGGAEDDGFFNRALFLQLAQKTGLDIPTFTSCMDSNKYASQVASDTQAASALGVNSTPTFFVNGTQILGAEPYATFEEVINAALK